MKTKKRNYIFLAVLMMGIATMMTGCAKEDIASSDNGGGTNPTDMNGDELNVKVTADVPTAVLSSFDEKSMGGALVRRLSKTTSSLDADTKMVLIKGEDILNRPMTEWFEMAKIYLRGGYIAVEKPHNAHLVSVMEQLSTHFEQATHAILTEDDGSGIIINYNPSNSQSANAVNAEAERFKARIANINALASTRSGAGEADPVAEMVIFSTNGYYHCAPTGTMNIVTTSRDKNGKETTSTHTITNEYTPYEMGLQADGAAQWLNNRDAAQQVRRASTRGNGSDAINDLMSADEEYNYQGPLNCLYGWDPWADFKSRPNALSEIIRVWGVHAMDTNKDYYFVDHKIVASVGGKKDGDDYCDPSKSLYSGPYEKNKFFDVVPFGIGNDYEPKLNDGSRTYDKIYSSWYGGGDYSMNLTGKGSIQLEDAKPSTDNNEGSTTINVGSFESTTTTIGGTVTPGFSQKMGASFSASGTYTRGYTEGKVFITGSTVNYKELTCKKNTDGTKVSWTYGCGPDMMAGDWDEHPLAPDALVNDVDMTNQACWSVSNPDSTYTVNIDHKTTMSSLISADEDDLETYYDGIIPNLNPGDKTIINVADDSKPLTYTLPAPNRAEQTWYMDVDFPELGQDGYKGVKDELTDALKTQFPNIYQPTIVLADQTPKSENTIKNLVDMSKKLLNDPNALQTLKGYALDRGVSQFTIKWYCTDGNHPEPYTMTVTAK